MSCSIICCNFFLHEQIICSVLPFLSDVKFGFVIHHYLFFSRFVFCFHLLTNSIDLICWGWWLFVDVSWRIFNLHVIFMGIWLEGHCSQTASGVGMLGLAPASLMQDGLLHLHRRCRGGWRFLQALMDLLRFSFCPWPCLPLIFSVSLDHLHQAGSPKHLAWQCTRTLDVCWQQRSCNMQPLSRWRIEIPLRRFGCHVWFQRFGFPTQFSWERVSAALDDSRWWCRHGADWTAKLKRNIKQFTKS